MPDASTKTAPSAVMVAMMMVRMCGERGVEPSDGLVGVAMMIVVFAVEDVSRLHGCIVRGVQCACSLTSVVDARVNNVVEK